MLRARALGTAQVASGQAVPWTAECRQVTRQATSAVGGALWESSGRARSPEMAQAHIVVLIPLFFSVLQVFPLPSLPRKQPTVLVVCGPDQNGAIGLVCARHLRMFVSILNTSPTSFSATILAQAGRWGFLTGSRSLQVQLINDAYNVVIDAILGVDAEPGEVKEPYTSILATLKQIQIPIVSLDVPSGWDVETGNSEGITTRFLGRHHFLAGRFLPYDVQKKFELNLPEYPGTECVVSV
uniref:YjeF N-terminal domain containing 3 n=1 Tax=Chelonoidis abingdonii TaxID=106734 RepID=A0A8C0GA04_CHEAB